MKLTSASLALALVVSACSKAHSKGEFGETSSTANASDTPSGGPSYRWDSRPWVPLADTLASVPPSDFPQGELGVSEFTRLYLPMHDAPGVDGVILDRSGHGAEVRCNGGRAIEGRIGGGLAISAEHPLEVGREGEAWLDGPFTLDLDFKVEGEGRVHLVSAPDLFSVTRDPKGRLALRIESDPVLWTSTPNAVLPGWNRLTVVSGGLAKHSVRILLNGEGSQRVVTEGPAPEAFERLIVGGAYGGIDGAQLSLDELSLRARPLYTDELLDELSNIVEPPQGPRLLSVRDASGQLTQQRLWFGGITSPELSGEAWGQGELRHLSAADGLRWVPATWDQDTPELRPAPRTTQSMAFMGDHRILVFGGEARDSHLNPQINADDTWIYHTDRMEWEDVSSELRPAPRCHVPAAYSPKHDIVLMAGGFLNGQYVENKKYDDTWAYRSGAKDWVLVDAHDTLPAFSDTALVYHESAGVFVLVLYNRVFVYSPELDLWSRLPKPKCVDASGQKVSYSPGGSPMAVYDPESRGILVFGGVLVSEDGPAYQAQTSWYDLKKNQFVVEEHDVKPSPRVRSGFALDPNRGHVVLFGGVQGQFSEREGDLWLYDLSDHKWREVEAANAPSARGGLYGMSYDPDLDRHFVVCGRSAPERFLNEVWRLAVDDEAWGEARYVFEQAAFDGDSAWFVDWKNPSGLLPEARFRATSDRRTWSDWSPELASIWTFGVQQIEVELRVPPGEGSAVRSMGFCAAGETSASAEDWQRVLLPLSAIQ